MTFSKGEEVEVSGYIEHDTPDAILLRCYIGTKQVKVWIARSQIEDYSGQLKVGEDVDVFIPEWLAEKLGVL